MSNPIETVIVRGQQKFDPYDVLNPADTNERQQDLKYT